jgi:hypothetical protein
MQSTWGESWKSSEIITTKIAFTSRSVAALRENDLANRRPPMPSLITTRSVPDADRSVIYEFARDGL